MCTLSRRIKEHRKKRRTIMLEMVGVMDRSNQKALPYGEKENDGRWGRCEKGLARPERSGSYVVGATTTITMHEPLI